jgi:signal transduction histidine kinase/BarA-like signal transduction histidine kinase
MKVRNKLIALLDEANEARIYKLNHSIELVEQVMSLCDIPNYIDIKARALSQLSLYSMIIGNNEESLKYAHNSILLFEELNDEKGIADAKYSIASVYYKSDNYHIGLVFLIDALNIYKKFDDYYNISRCEKSLGTVYEYSGDQNSAVKSYENAILAAKKIKNLNLESNVYNNLSGVYIKQGKVDLAATIIEKSVVLKKQTGDTRGLAFAIYGRAKVYFALKRYEESETDFIESIRIHTEMGERLGLAMCYHKFAKFYLELNQLEKAKQILAIGIEISTTYNITIIKFKCYYLSYIIHKLQNDKTAALEYLELYLQEKEAVLNTQTLKVIDSYEMLVQMKTMQKEAELQIEKTEMLDKSIKIEASAKVRQEFLSTMSHEIRTPLNAITTIVSMLGENSNDDEKKLIDSLKFSSNLLMWIINDILDFTKLDLGKMKLEFYPVEIRKLIENIWRTYEFQAKEKGLKFILTTNIPNENSYLLDEVKLTQILGNLISNAMKFTDKGIVELEVNIVKNTMQIDTLLFKIKDTGEGIEPKNINKIFDSFAQIKNPITRKKGGAGLGLAIVKSLIQLHGSEIEVSSLYGSGTEFTFQLNLTKNSLVIENKGIIKLEKLENKKILLAEDNAINAFIAIKLLSKWGIETDHVENGLKAVEKAKNNKYDLILMDIHMPEMDGFEATKEIRTSNNRNNKIPIYGLTADISAKDNILYKSYFTGFLLKPLEIEKLHLALTNSNSFC